MQLFWSAFQHVSYFTFQIVQSLAFIDTAMDMYFIAMVAFTQCLAAPFRS